MKTKKIKLWKDAEKKISKKNTEYILINGKYSYKTNEGWNNQFCSILLFQNCDLDKLKKGSEIRIDKPFEEKEYTTQDGQVKKSYSACIFSKDLFLLENEEKSIEEDGEFIDNIESQEVPF